MLIEDNKTKKRMPCTTEVWDKLVLKGKDKLYTIIEEDQPIKPLMSLRHDNEMKPKNPKPKKH